MDSSHPLTAPIRQNRHTPPSRTHSTPARHKPVNTRHTKQKGGPSPRGTPAARGAAQYPTGGRAELRPFGRNRLPFVLGELVHTTAGMWITRPPTRCHNEHPLGPGEVLVGHQACLGHGGGHTTWTCRTCDAVVYRPPLNTHCTTLDGPATVRISTAEGPKSVVDSGSYGHGHGHTHRRPTGQRRELQVRHSEHSHRRRLDGRHWGAWLRHGGSRCQQ